MQKTILIVEDDADLRISLRKILTANNFKVLEASDGAEALERVDKELPDLVILDFGLPVVSGETVCVRIKENHPEIVVIAVTEKKFSKDVVHGLQIGADDYITKPFVAEELIARIDVRLKSKSNKSAHELSAENSKEFKEYKLIFRESIVLIVLRILATELIFTIALVLSSSIFSFLSRYVEIFNNLFLNLVVFLIFLLVNIIIVLSIVLKWQSEYAELARGALTKHTGILNKREQKYACNFVEVITMNQSALGMIFDYGTIELYDPAIKEQIYLVNIASPRKYRELIEERFSKDRPQGIPFVAQ